MTEKRSNLVMDTKLNSSNYNLWVFHLLLILEDEQQIRNDVNTEVPPNCHPTRILESARSKRLIFQNVEKEIQTTLIHYATAVEMWDFLYQTYSGENAGRKNQGIKRLAMFKYDKATIEGNLEDLTQLISNTEVASGKLTISIAELGIHMFLNCLPSRFGSVRAILEAGSEPLTLSAVRRAMVSEEERHRDRNDNKFNDFAGVAGFKKCTHDRNGAKCWTCHPELHPSRLICNDCKEVGHKSVNSIRCRNHKSGGIAGVVSSTKRSSEDDTFGPTPDFAPYFKRAALATDDLRHRINALNGKASGHAFSARGTMVRRADALVLDSGCTQSILMNKEQLQNYRSYFCNFSTADAGTLQCVGIGNLFVSPDLTIKDVLYCPEISMNLISVSQLCDQGHTMSVNRQTITLTKNRRVVLTARCEDGLYQFFPSVQRALLAGNARTSLFHRRLGHLNLKSLRLLSHLSDGLVLDNDPEESCSICAQSKATRSTFAPSSSLALRIGELTHADVCHIGVPTILGGCTMFLLLIDDATRFTTIYLLKHKDDCTDFIIDYNKQLFNKTGRHLSIVRSDGGGEFFNTALKEYFQSVGTVQQSSTPHTPEHNSRAERANRTTLEGISSMLLDSQLPWNYWGYAAECFIYLKNRSPHAALPRSTPYQEWHRKLPDLTNLRVFGYDCWVYVPGAVRRRQGQGHKLLPKSRRMIFVGYSDKFKAWRCFDPLTKQVVFSCDVRFDSEQRKVQSSAVTESLSDFATPLNTFTLPSILDQREVLMNNPGFEDPPVSSTEVLHTISADELSDSPDVLPAVSTDSLSQSGDDTSADALSESSADPLTEGSSRMAGASNRELHDSDSSTSDEDSTPNDRIHALLAKCSTALLISNDSPTYAKAMRSVDKPLWDKAIAAEYASLREHQVFSEPCVLPYGFKALDTKMVLKLKEPEGSNTDRRMKARLCVRGFLQEHGVNYNLTFAPVATYNSLRMFLSVMATLDYEIDTVDIKTAFLLSNIKEEVYINIPEGYPCSDKEKVLRLKKCLYGLKQAPMEWNAELDSHLKSIGFFPTVSDPCIYVCNSQKEFILVYVDDLVIATKSRERMQHIKDAIHAKLPLTDKGPINRFLNIHFKRDRKLRQILMSQPVKIANVLEDQQLLPDDLAIVKVPSKVPACPSTMLNEQMCPQTAEETARMAKLPYKSILGQVLFIAITARPDLATAVSACGKFAHKPGKEHWLALMRILSYLQGTKDLELVLGGCATSITLSAYSDADWAGDLDRRKSRSGYIILMNESPIIWSWKLQLSVALSSTEAEYIALSLASRDVIWCRALLSELGFAQKEPTAIYEDNDSCIKIAQSAKQLPGVKHIDIRHHFIRDRIHSGEIKLERMRTGEMVADILTKQLPYPAFKKHRTGLKLQ